ncbi:MAG: CBS domain-containing protein [Bacteroidota bacterium]|nr:CBS domain-containing protein [Bacteroidota bacterium]
MLISTSTPPLQPDDSVEYGLGLMMELRVRHLPVVSPAGRLLGLLSEEMLLDAESPATTVETLLGAEPISISNGLHVFDATKVMMDHDLTLIPVVDDEQQFQGIVRRHDLFERFARMLATQESGAIVALEVEERDLSLSKIIYVIEQNDVKVLSLSTEAQGDVVGVTIKLNVREASRVRHILEHHGYKVVAAFGEEEDAEDLLDRVQEFMRYLEA